MNTTNWKISTLRWLAWAVLVAGMVFGIFIIRSTGIAVINRSLAQHAINSEQTGRPTDIASLSMWADFDNILLVFIVGVIVVALVVFLDYYLRSGERNGRLLRRTGLVFGIESGVYLLALLIQYIAANY